AKALMLKSTATPMECTNNLRAFINLLPGFLELDDGLLWSFGVRRRWAPTSWLHIHATAHREGISIRALLCCATAALKMLGEDANHFLIESGKVCGLTTGHPILIDHAV